MTDYRLSDMAPRIEALEAVMVKIDGKQFVPRATYDDLLSDHMRTVRNNLVLHETIKALRK